jgi:hypothetical protein
LLLNVPPAGAIAALVSLAFFTTFLIGRLRAGVRAPCACFGSSRAQPISVRDVIRNLLLMALAVVSLATDRPTTIAPLDALAVLAVIAAAGGALHLAGRVRSR